MSAPPNIISDHDLELLSAYLDGELTDREKYNLEQRLVREEVLRLTLDDLRDTVILVQSLPRLHAPRNFTLDPARYGRKIPWWRRWFSAERGLQWAGALGSIASMVLIAVGLLLSGGNETENLAESQPSNEDSGYAAASAPTIQPAVGGAMIDDTAIAYSGDDLFQATLAMQSAYYGGTETAEATLTSPSMKDESETPVALAPAAAAVEESPPVVEMAVGGEADAGLYPTPTGIGAGQSLNVFNTVESSPAEGMMEAEGMVQGAGALPEDQQTFAMDAASAGEPEAAPGAVQPAPAPPAQAAQPENAAGAMREHDEQSGAPTGEQPGGRIDDEASVTPENQTTEAIPSSPEAADMMNAPTVSTAAEVAQESTASTETQPQNQRQATQPDQEQNNWWLVGAGLMMLFVSIAVFLIGLKKARGA